MLFSDKTLTETVSFARSKSYPNDKPFCTETKHFSIKHINEFEGSKSKSVIGKAIDLSLSRENEKSKNKIDLVVINGD